ncbi:MAG: hypothetical protein ABIA78_01615 [archaeon]
MNLKKDLQRTLERNPNLRNWHEFAVKGMTSHQGGGLLMGTYQDYERGIQYIFSFLMGIGFETGELLKEKLTKVINYEVF